MIDNVDASVLGEIALRAGSLNRVDVGDLIDRGLILSRLLKEAGYELTKITVAEASHLEAYRAERKDPTYTQADQARIEERKGI